ncbi:MAG: DUF2892 domain-containing protein [Halothiobacillaceae bacterium]|jgi:hypothetical protein|nr:DUF2892 domain-containing protein [Halothiobacillaceae bacterium]MDY0050262.1 DUF2892 domain-containing protein [Halothiobacillaceae bacterium]
MTTDRIVRIVAGFMIMLSLALTLLHSPYWLILTAFVGFNLFQSGFTRFCPLDSILAKMGVRRAQ